MGAQDSELTRKAIWSLVKQMPGWGHHNFVCTVKEVDWNNRCCTVIDSDEREFTNVRLRSVIDGTTGICCRPAIDSYVIIEQVEMIDTDMYVAKFSDIDEIDIEIGQTTINVKDGEITFNGGNNAGMVILGKLTTNLNTIKDYLTVLVGAISAGLNAVNGGPAGAQVFQTAMTGQSITFQNMENTKIKQ